MTLTVQENQAVLRKIAKTSEGTVSVSFAVRFNGEDDMFTLSARATDDGELHFYCGTGVLQSGRYPSNKEYRTLLDLSLSGYRDSPAVKEEVRRTLLQKGVTPIFTSEKGKNYTLRELSLAPILQILSGHTKPKERYAGSYGEMKLRVLYEYATKYVRKMKYTLNEVIARHRSLKGGVN